MRRAFLLAPIALAAIAASCGGGDDGAESTPATHPTATLSTDGNCQRTINHFEFPVILPSVFPQDVRLVEACTHEDLPGLPAVQQAEIIYRNPDESVEIQVATANAMVVPVKPDGREEIDLGNGVTGYIQDRDRGDGTRFWGIEFEAEGRAYTVIAVFGPENKVTEESIIAMAESIAGGNPIQV
jgi:hypothetical protein